METINITRHAEKRASQRGITMEQISMCLDFGEKLNRTGVQFYFFSNRLCKAKLQSINFFIFANKLFLKVRLRIAIKK